MPLPREFLSKGGIMVSVEAVSDLTDISHVSPFRFQCAILTPEEIHSPLSYTLCVGYW